MSRHYGLKVEVEWGRTPIKQTRYQAPLLTPSDSRIAAPPSPSTLFSPLKHPYYQRSPDEEGFFHCPFTGSEECQHERTKQKCLYNKYLDTHLKPYRCNQCQERVFASNACLFIHEREAHGFHRHKENPHLCWVPGCERSKPGNGFPRRRNARDHMKRVHGTEMPEFDGQAAYDGIDENRGPPAESKFKLLSSSVHYPKAESASMEGSEARNYPLVPDEELSVSRCFPMAFKPEHSQTQPISQCYLDSSYENTVRRAGPLVKIVSYGSSAGALCQAHTDCFFPVDRA